MSQKLWLNSPPGPVPHGSLPLAADLSRSEKTASTRDGAWEPPVPWVGSPGQPYCNPLGHGVSWATGNPSLRAWGSIQKHCAVWSPNCYIRTCACTCQLVPTALPMGPQSAHLGQNLAICPLLRNMSVCVCAHSEPSLRQDSSLVARLGWGSPLGGLGTGPVLLSGFFTRSPMDSCLRGMNEENWGGKSYQFETKSALKIF